MKKLLAILLCTLLVCTTLTACGGGGGNQNGGSQNKGPSWEPKPFTGEVVSDSLYVEKVNNLPEDFIMGMDASSVISLETAGVKFYDYNGTEQDVFKTLAENGINYIRVRVWNDPFNPDGMGYGGGNCNIDTAVAIGKRATLYGMKLLVNFHYSDFWADPAKQMCPKAWGGMAIEEKAEALKTYTTECLTKLKNEGVDVGMVQIGNETNGKLAGEKIWSKICTLIKAGSESVRTVFPKALVAVHFANPEKVSNYYDYAKKLAYYSVDYDVFASSYYPYWHGTLENLSTLLSDIATTYDKKVMVAETSYCYMGGDTDFYGNTVGDGSAVTKPYPYTIQGQTNSIRDIINTVAHMTNGIGVFYWEGTWIATGGKTWEDNYVLWETYGTGWATSYAVQYDPDDAGKYFGGNAVDNQAMFDENGKPLESLKVFALVREGNKNVTVKADAIEDVTLICDLNGEIVLPTTVNAIMTDNSREALPVVWQEIDREAMKNGGVAKYDIIGQAGGMTAHCYISMVEFNFLNNYSFEDDADTSWVVIGKDKEDELYVEDKVTDSLTGNKHYHFWSAATNSVDFSLEQEVKNLPSGNYKFTISIMGGDAGTTEIYAYVKINGQIAHTANLAITSYGNWDTATIPNFSYTAGDTISVGIYVKCSGSGNGAWGKIDDALLNSVS